MTYAVVFSPEAVGDLAQLFAPMLECDLHNPPGDPDLPQQAIDAIRQAGQLLAHSPFSCRKAGPGPFLRELIIAFGTTGYVALFEIRNNQNVIVGAVRHQRESDYH
ncbi:MAG: hypothetical protein GAK30_02814 [Paracidovorax wautersii]|uniref:Plasmid stabilization system protein ParE n=1 Tax=Paracidovorax wautersii TaxID=1177982 RepID=A0A7V8FM74_9BURK|nr:MAG: hypothetical protein GAK30_02814 [Paracidovorax wautersii]